jgi:hypothetical protein
MGSDLGIREGSGMIYMSSDLICSDQGWFDPKES